MDAKDGGHAADTPLRVGRGPRAVEALLLGELEGLVAATRAAPGRLALPARVVVPSRGLREHVCAALVRRVGHGTAGIRVDTLHGLALDVIDRAGERAPRGDDLVPLLVRRAARREEVLRRAFEGLEDGYGAVGAAVSDLLDAGFAPDVAAHGDAVDDALASAALDADVRERVRAVVRVAAATAR